MLDSSSSASAADEGSADWRKRRCATILAKPIPTTGKTAAYNASKAWYSGSEEIRAQILQQLADQGFEGDAEVLVSEDGDQQTIEIRLTDDEVVEE